jgi:hypothetical protein
MKIRIAVLLLFAAQANATVLYGTLGNGWLAEFDLLADAYSFTSQETSFTSIAFQTTPVQVHEPGTCVCYYFWESLDLESPEYIVNLVMSQI